MLSQEVQEALGHPPSSMILSNIMWTLPDLYAFRILEYSTKYIKSDCRISLRNRNYIFPSLYMIKLISNKGHRVLPTHKGHKTEIIESIKCRQGTKKKYIASKNHLLLRGKRK